jgi:hypothetical protein
VGSPEQPGHLYSFWQMREICIIKAHTATVVQLASTGLLNGTLGNNQRHRNLQLQVASTSGAATKVLQHLPAQITVLNNDCVTRHVLVRLLYSLGKRHVTMVMILSLGISTAAT